MPEDSSGSPGGDEDAKRRLDEEMSDPDDSDDSGSWDDEDDEDEEGLTPEELEEIAREQQKYREQRERREQRQLWLSIPVMVAIGGAILWYQDRFFHWAVHHMWIAVIVFAAGLPFLAIVIWKGGPGHQDRITRAWAIFLFAALVWFGTKSVLAAHDREWADCWTFNREKTAAGEITMQECAPGSEPGGQGTSFNQDSGTGSSNFCDYVNTSSSGGTIWRCTYEEF